MWRFLKSSTEIKFKKGKKNSRYQSNLNLNKIFCALHSLQKNALGVVLVIADSSLNRDPSSITLAVSRREAL